MLLLLRCAKRIKTDNAPAYTSQAFAKFRIQWGIEHITGIPYNPQGQGIIERIIKILKYNFKD